EADLFNLKDTTVFQRLKKIEVLNTETDVLNFMTKMNWNLVTVLSATQFNIEIFYFKRQFDISEFND
ncbi:hypothetical protein, partial [Burkholderia sp. GbtcB21]|uniref:hypothetical protein n=1 Tax=Burkholderia sp. GbtcB21 TaxID=2824766 RepID=UPI001C2F45B2